MKCQSLVSVILLSDCKGILSSEVILGFTVRSEDLKGSLVFLRYV